MLAGSSVSTQRKGTQANAQAQRNFSILALVLQRLCLCLCQARFPGEINPLVLALMLAYVLASLVKTWL